MRPMGTALYRISALVVLAYLWGTTDPLMGAGPAPTPAFAAIAKKSRSRARVGAFDVLLVADDEEATTLSDSYCGGDRGARDYHGTYRLISARDGDVVASLDIGRRYFTQGRLHDGLRVVPLPKSRERLLAIYGYGSCNGEDLTLYRTDSQGGLYVVPFVHDDGST